MDDYVVLPDIDLFNDYTLHLSVLNKGYGDYETLISKRPTSNVHGGYEFSQRWDGPPYGTHGYSDIYGCESDYSVPLEEYNFLTLTYADNQMTIYINGEIVKQCQNIPNANNIDNDINTLIGKTSEFGIHHNGDNTRLFYGSIADVSIWESALSEQFINQIIEGVEESEIPEVLKAHYKFNAGSGDTLYDHSVNGNHGIINGARWLTNGTKHVAEDGSDETGNGSANSPFSSIQFAINMASDGDSVLVSAGTYYENVNFNGKNIALIGENRETTIIDGGQNGRVVELYECQDFGQDIVSILELSNFTIENGKHNGGGGIYIYYSSPYLNNLIIRNNIANSDGGGIHSHAGIPIMENLLIYSNHASDYGGGLYIENTLYIGDTWFSVISNCNIYNNNSDLNGGGIYIGYSQVILTNSNINDNSASMQGGGIFGSFTSLSQSLIFDNSATHGGAIYFTATSQNPIISNSTIINNFSADGGGIYCDGKPIIVNSILWNNNNEQITISNAASNDSTKISYSDVEGGQNGVGGSNHGAVIWHESNIDADPLFVAPDNGDYTLQITSPCIDAGDPDLDGDGEDYTTDTDDQDPDGTRADMGAYPFYHIWGCTDESACNYDSEANTDDGSCNLPDCAGECNGEETGDNYEDYYCGTCDDVPANDCIDYSFEFHAEYNLISFNTIPTDNSVDNVLSSLGDNAITLIGEGNAAIHIENDWIGSLTSILHEDGYWLLVNESDSLNLIGVPIQPEQLYELHEGHNLISYPFSECGLIEEVLPDDVEACIYAIAGEGAATLNEDGWVGALESLCPDEGYWFNSLCDKDFTFDEPTSLARKQVLSLSPYPYNQSSQQAFYFIESVENIEIGDWILAYNGDVVIGARQWQGSIIDVPAMGDDGNDFTRGYIEAEVTPQFKLLQDDKLINLEGDIPVFENNGLYMVSSLTEAMPLPETFSLDRAYPNPFNPVTTLRFGLPIEAQVSLTIYNLQGREVMSLIDGNMDAGYHSVLWDADNNASGVYFVKMIAGSYISTQKLMLVK